MPWTTEDAERYLGSLQPLGMRFGLDRIRKLVAVLGMPQHRFASVHVVGTNGKSSVTEITAALIEAHGLSTGAYLSPHDERWRERVQIGGAEIAPEPFGAAVERVAAAVEAVNRTLDEGESVTQFEADTASAFVALAAARVDVGVIEAGLGGRLDATNVLPSKVTVLTSVGLEHTEYLGDTEEEIAGEKLAVLRDHSTLVTGPLSPAVADVARAVASERRAKLVTVRDLAPAVTLASAAPYLRRNFAVALAATEAIVGSLDPERVLAVAAGLRLPGRMEVIEADPVVVLDAAHNPAGAAALAEALPAFAGGRPVDRLCRGARRQGCGRATERPGAVGGRGRRDRDPRTTPRRSGETRGAGAGVVGARRGRGRRRRRTGGGGRRPRRSRRPSARDRPGPGRNRPDHRLALPAALRRMRPRAGCPGAKPTARTGAQSRLRNSFTSRFSQSVWSLTHPSRSRK